MLAEMLREHSNCGNRTVFIVNAHGTTTAHGQLDAATAGPLDELLSQLDRMACRGRGCCASSRWRNSNEEAAATFTGFFPETHRSLAAPSRCRDAAFQEVVERLPALREVELNMVIAVVDAEYRLHRGRRVVDTSLLARVKAAVDTEVGRRVGMAVTAAA